MGDDGLGESLSGADVVVIPAGVPRKPGMTRDDLFNTNASIVQSLTAGVAKHCPDAMVAIISNPVNSTVPIAAETLKAAGVYNPRRLFGVTTLDVLRSNTFVAELMGTNPEDVEVNVVGGHAGITILPLLSQVPGLSLSDDQIAALTKRIMFGGDEVVQKKADSGMGGSATLSMAAAGARFTASLLDAMSGKSGVTECAYVDRAASPQDGLEYFSTRITLGPDGVQEIGEIGPLSDFEKKCYDEMIPELKGSIAKGVKFVADN
jgi:malate dehydrogenase